MRSTLRFTNIDRHTELVKKIGLVDSSPPLHGWQRIPNPWVASRAPSAAPPPVAPTAIAWHRAAARPPNGHRRGVWVGGGGAAGGGGKRGTRMASGAPRQARVGGAVRATATVAAVARSSPSPPRVALPRDAPPPPCQHARSRRPPTAFDRVRRPPGRGGTAAVAPRRRSVIAGTAAVVPTSASAATFFFFFLAPTALRRSIFHRFIHCCPSLSPLVPCPSLLRPLSTVTARPASFVPPPPPVDHFRSLPAPPLLPVEYRLPFALPLPLSPLSIASTCPFSHHGGPYHSPTPSPVWRRVWGM